MEQKQAQYEVRILGEILVAERPKGILSVSPMKGPDSYKLSFEQEKKANEFCRSEGIRVIPVHPSEIQRMRDIGDSEFGKMIINGIASELDLGLIYHSCLCCDYDGFRSTLRGLENIFSRDKIYVISPKKKVVANLSYADIYHSNLDVKGRLITL